MINQFRFAGTICALMVLLFSSCQKDLGFEQVTNTAAFNLIESLQADGLSDQDIQEVTALLEGEATAQNEVAARCYPGDGTINYQGTQGVHFTGVSQYTSDFIWILKKGGYWNATGSVYGVNSFCETEDLNCGSWDGVILIRNGCTDQFVILEEESKFYQNCW